VSTAALTCGEHLVEGDAVPEPVLVSIAAALAGRAVKGLYELVRAHFADDPDATAALDAAEGAAEDSPEVRELGERLERAEAADPEFGERLRAEWAATGVNQRAESGGVTNLISGSVSGKVVQARDITGNVSF
jgi:hypothetical protein